MLDAVVYIKDAIWIYFKYVYYGLKQRWLAFKHKKLGIFAFLKSLIRVPFEAYVFTGMHIDSLERIGVI